MQTAVTQLPPRVSSYIGQTLAGNAVLLEIGARLGIVDPLFSRERVSVADVADQTGIEKQFVSDYYSALSHAGLAEACRSNAGIVTHYIAPDEFPTLVNDVAYTLWAMASCAPLISNARSFSRDLVGSFKKYPRDGEHVARTSKWMGELAFYPQAEELIVSQRPKKIVDLGAGTCGLLMRCLRRLPDAEGIAIDVNSSACEKARSILRGQKMDQRINVIEMAIQDLVNAPAPLERADVIHGGFVFHDLMPDEEEILESLFKTFREKAPSATLLIADIVPYSTDPDERSFSAALTFLHSHFMGRQLLSENGWRAKVLRAGYKSMEVRRLGISGGRIFCARVV